MVALALIIDLAVFLPIMQKVETKKLNKLNGTKKSEKNKKPSYIRDLPEGSVYDRDKYLRVVYDHIENPYRWMAFGYVCKENAKREKLDREVKELLNEISQTARYGTKEQRQRRELTSKLDAINDSIKNSNSSGSYDMYDDHGNYVGRIDKKD